MTPLLPIPEVIVAKLRQFAWRRKFVATLRGIAESVIAFAIGIIVVALIEAVFRPQLPTRTWLSSLNYFVASAWLIIRAGRPLLSPSPLRQTARAFETAANNRFQERILSAVEMAETTVGNQPGVSAWMIGKTISLAADEIRDVDPAAFVDRAPAIRFGKYAVGFAVALGLSCLIPTFGGRVWLALNPQASTAVLSQTRLVVTPGNIRVKQGAALEIKASANTQPEQAKVIITWDDGFQESVAMSHTTNGFVLTVPSVSQGFRYSVQVDDAESLFYHVRVDVPPRIARMQLYIQPPPYTHWTNRYVEGGTAEFLVGSRIRIGILATNERIAQADWISEVQTQKLTPNNGWLTLDLQPTNPIIYQIKLTGENKLPSESFQKWTLRPTADAPPTARLVATGADAGMVGFDEILLLQAQATDDIGLKRVDLIVLNQDSAVDVKHLPVSATNANRDVSSFIKYNLADLKLFAGEELQVQLVATDLSDQTTRSEPISLTIGGSDKALEAQLAARLKALIAATDTQLDYLKQTRSSWLTIGRNYKEEDPATQGPALTLLNSRLNEFGREVSMIGDRLISESESNSVAEARILYRLGTTMTAWAGQQRGVLLDNCSRLDKTTNAYAVFNHGRDLFNLAQTDFQEFRHALIVVQGFFETDVMAARCESAQGRYRRGLPILRGETPADSLSSATGPGLRATFFEGVQLGGRVLEQKLDRPSFDSYTPAGHREHWSARYEGEINIAEAGDWTLECIADDGVRVMVDGKSILPKEAWAAHSANEFKGDVNLTVGWHPIAIDFFQTTGESKLRFLAGRKNQPLQEVSVSWLRPPQAVRPEPDLADDPTLSPIVKGALKDRIKRSMQMAASVPPALVPLTNEVEKLALPVREKASVGDALSSNLVGFASWKLEDSRKAEAQADNLTLLAKDAQRILREELDRYRWHYEGAAALKKLQNAIVELREINNELRQQPWHQNSAKRTEQEQAKVDLAKTWQAELEKAADDVAHQFFETAKQRDATLAERTTALSATTKTEKELQPAIDKLSKTIDELHGNKDEMAGLMEHRLNEIADRYRELNDMQERINREQVAAQARKALPAVRAFERAQKTQSAATMPEKYVRMKEAVAEIEKAERVTGNYQGAEKLETLSGTSPADAKGKETFDEVRGLAMQTDSNLPSLAQTIPQPMQQQTEALDKKKTTSQESANQLSKPRLAMALEAARLNQQGDRKTAVAYSLLGQDMGQLLESPNTLNAATLRPLADRAAALSGQKGEDARQAEIKAANERAQQMAKDLPANADALAAQMDELSSQAAQAAGDDRKKGPVTDRLKGVAELAKPVPNWSESTDAREIAASAARESLTGIEAAPKQWESYNDASQILADAARQLRMENAVSDVAALNPYPAVPDGPPSDIASMANSQDPAKITGTVGQASRQAVPKGMDQAEWSRLTERLRKGIRGAGIENFSEEQQAAIRAYFERLGK